MTLIIPMQMIAQMIMGAVMFGCFIAITALLNHMAINTDDLITTIIVGFFDGVVCVGLLSIVAHYVGWVVFV